MCAEEADMPTFPFYTPLGPAGGVELLISIYLWNSLIIMSSSDDVISIKWTCLVLPSVISTASRKL